MGPLNSKYSELKLTNPNQTFDNLKEDVTLVDIVADLQGITKSEAKRLINQGAVTLFIPEANDK